MRSGRVVIEGKGADFQRAFNVELTNFGSGTESKLGNTGTVSIPKELAKHVRSVLGIDERAVVSSNYQAQVAQKPMSSQWTLPMSDYDLAAHNEFLKQGGYLATQIAHAQNMELRTGGEGQRGVFVSVSGGIDLADYNRFFAKHGLEQPKPLGIIEVDRAKNSPGVP